MTMLFAQSKEYIDLLLTGKTLHLVCISDCITLFEHFHFARLLCFKSFSFYFLFNLSEVYINMVVIKYTVVKWD